MMLRVGLIVAAVLLAALGFQTWRANHALKELHTAEIQLRKAGEIITAERENTRKANEAATRHQARVDTLEADRRNNPLPAVRLCPRARAVLPAATAGVGEAAEADHAGADAEDRDAGVDIGPALDDYATDAEANVNQCEELMTWLEKR